MPRYVFMNRDDWGGSHNGELEEFDDYIIVNGTRMNKV
jgi:hypothetical protein